MIQVKSIQLTMSDKICGECGYIHFEGHCYNKDCKLGRKTIREFYD